MHNTAQKNLTAISLKLIRRTIAADGITWFTYDNVWRKKSTKKMKQQQFALIRVFVCILHGSLISRNYHIVVGVFFYSPLVALCFVFFYLLLQPTIGAHADANAVW